MIKGLAQHTANTLITQEIEEMLGITIKDHLSVFLVQRKIWPIRYFK